jgi:hypothetical protein
MSDDCTTQCLWFPGFFRKPLLRRLVKIIRNSFSGVPIRVRLDGGFAHPAVWSLWMPSRNSKTPHSDIRNIPPSLPYSPLCRTHPF